MSDESKTEPEKILSIDEATETETKKNKTGKSEGITSIYTQSEDLQQRETTRSKLAIGLLWLISITVIGIGIYIFLGTYTHTQSETKDIDTYRELITLIWTSEVALVSGALGFYFGSQQDN